MMNNEKSRGMLLPSTYINYLTGDLTKAKIRGLLIYFSVVSILELLAYLYHGVFSVIASRLWILTGIVCLITIIAYLIKSVLLDVIKKRYLAIASLFILTVLLAFAVGNLRIAEINPDAAQQAAAGLESFKTGDFNYTGTAFLNYPNRQYILAAVPALLFGRSIFTLQLGFAYPFIVGIFILYCAFRKWARKLGIDTNLSVIPIIALLVFPFTAEYYTNFEQAIYPMSFGMITIGFFLLMLCKPNVINTLCLAWAGCLLCNSYTPALALFGLLLVFTDLAALQWVRKPEAMPFAVASPVLAAEAFILTEINIIVFFISTLLNKGQESVIGIQRGVNLFKLSYQSIYDFLIDKNAVFLGMLGVAVIIYLFAGLTFQLKLRDFLIALWVLGVFTASYLMTGYIEYQPAWIMQRALVIIPVVITGAALTVFDALSRNRIKVNSRILIVIVFTLTFIGWSNFNRPNQSFIYFNYIQPMKYMLADLEDTVRGNHLKPESRFNLLVYTENTLIKNPSDYCRFLFPNASIYVPDTGLLPEDINLNQDTFIYADYEVNSLPVPVNEVITYKNKKHEIEGTWYKGSITKKD